ncbi:MAG: hypothetical protein LBQ60_04090 [Bacteroidales bacterium]|nr:hypothetical protein [Bacteroidales bacterium]
MKDSLKIICLLFIISICICCKTNTSYKIYDPVKDKDKELEIRKRRFLSNKKNPVKDSALYANFDIGVDAFSYIVKGELSGTLLFICNNDFYPSYKIEFDSISYSFVINYDSEKIIHIVTSDKHFICNGYKIGDIMDTAKIEREKILVRSGWGYYYPLENGWNAFVGGSDSLNYTITSFFKTISKGEPINEYEKRINEFIK